MEIEFTFKSYFVLIRSPCKADFRMSKTAGRHQILKATLKVFQFMHFVFSFFSSRFIAYRYSCWRGNWPHSINNTCIGMLFQVMGFVNI